MSASVVATPKTETAEAMETVSSTSPTSTSTRSTFPISPRRARSPAITSTTRSSKTSQRSQHRRRNRRAAQLREARSRRFSAASLDPTTRGDREMVLGNIQSHLAHPRDHPPLGEESRQLLQHLRQRAPSRSWSANSLRPTIACVRSSRAKSRCPALLDRGARQSRRIRHASTPRSPSSSCPASSASSSTMCPPPSPTPKTRRSKPNSRRPTPPSSPRSTSYLDWLKTDLLPRSNGDFRIGADTFSKKLQYDEMVDMPLDKLLEIGCADLHKNQAALQPRSPRNSSPTKIRAQCSKNSAQIHPAPDQLIPRFHAPPSTA